MDLLSMKRESLVDAGAAARVGRKERATEPANRVDHVGRKDFIPLESATEGVVCEAEPSSRLRGISRAIPPSGGWDGLGAGWAFRGGRL